MGWNWEGPALEPPKPGITPSREWGEHFPSQSHPWVLWVPNSRSHWDQRLLQAPCAPSPHRPWPLRGCRWPRVPPGAASTAAVALAGGSSSVGCGAQGQSRGKGVGVGVPGLGPPEAGGVGHPPALPITSQFIPPCCTGGTGALPTDVPLSLCPNTQHPAGLAGNGARTVKGFLAFICSISWHQGGDNK